MGQLFAYRCELLEVQQMNQINCQEDRGTQLQLLNETSRSRGYERLSGHQMLGKMVDGWSSALQNCLVSLYQENRMLDQRNGWQHEIEQNVAERKNTLESQIIRNYFKQGFLMKRTVFLIMLATAVNTAQSLAMNPPFKIAWHNFKHISGAEQIAKVIFSQPISE